MVSKNVEIYKLTFPDCDKVYIGSSVNASNRYKQHVADLLAKKHCNVKLQRYFNKYKTMPTIEVIDYCKEVERFKVEQDWINKFNSIFSGFNIATASSSLSKTELEELELKDLREYKQKRRLELLDNNEFSSAYHLLVNLLLRIKHIYRKDVHSIEPNLLKDCKIKSASTSKLVKSFNNTVPVLIECIEDFIKMDETEKSYCLYIAGIDFGYGVLEKKTKTQTIKSLGDVLLESIIHQNRFNNMMILNEMLKEDYEEICR